MKLSAVLDAVFLGGHAKMFAEEVDERTSGSEAGTFGDFLKAKIG